MICLRIARARSGSVLKIVLMHDARSGKSGLKTSERMHCLTYLTRRTLPRRRPDAILGASRFFFSAPRLCFASFAALCSGSAVCYYIFSPPSVAPDSRCETLLPKNVKCLRTRPGVDFSFEERFFHAFVSTLSTRSTEAGVHLSSSGLLYKRRTGRRHCEISSLSFLFLSVNTTNTARTLKSR